MACGRCGKQPQETLFSLRPNGRPCHLCKLCQRIYSRSHYNKNKDRLKEAYRKKARRVKDERTELIRRAKDRNCADCGLAFPYYVMQFDHARGRKIFNLGSSKRNDVALSVLMAEIAKCDVVCANCHMQRTHGK